MWGWFSTWLLRQPTALAVLGVPPPANPPDPAAVPQRPHRGRDEVIRGHIHHAALRELNGLLYGNDSD